MIKFGVCRAASGCPAAASDKEPVNRVDFDALERQVADSLRLATENLEA